MATMVDPRKVECLVAAGDTLGETPLWCERTGTLSWIDIDDPKLHRLDPATGHHTQMRHQATYLGSQALTRDGGRLLAHDLTLRRFAADGRETGVPVTVETGVDNRLNDGRVDARGRLWIGTMDNGLARPSGSLYRLDPDGTLLRLFGDVVVSNGICFSPDGRRMHFTDTRRHTSWVFDLDPDDGTLSNRRVFADYTATRERPDGACIDVDGCIWTAFFAGGRVQRQRPDGTVDLVVPMPVTNPTCVAFGGPDLRTLFVTSAAKFLSPAERAAEPLAGGLFAIHGIGQGLPDHRFGP